MNIKIFEKTDIELINNDVQVNRKQLQKLYNVPKMTLSDNIKKLKSDGLVLGTKIRTKYGRSAEVFNLDEVISIGFRLRSDIAIKFQRWAREIIRNKILELETKLRRLQIENDRLWDKEDKEDLYKRY